MKMRTLLSIDVKYPGGDRQISSIEVNAWDLDMEKLFDLFKHLLRAMGFNGVEGKHVMTGKVFYGIKHK